MDTKETVTGNDRLRDVLRQAATGAPEAEVTNRIVSLLTGNDRIDDRDLITTAREYVNHPYARASLVVPA